MLRWPKRNEYPRYYDLSNVPEGNILELLGSEMIKTLALLESVPPELERHRYAEGKWTVREVVAHVLDVERLFAYRALAFARNDPAVQPDMDQDDWVETSRAADRPLSQLAEELGESRRSHIDMFSGFGDEVWGRRGKIGRARFTVRTMPYVLVMHEIHHRGILRDRYLS